MPDVNMDYDRVLAVNNQLFAVTEKTLPRLTNLQTRVQNLLNEEGGLWLRKSSPVLSQKYTEFNSSVTQAVNNIPSFAHQFANVISSVQQLDDAITAGSK
jgi:hypothetical protein